jgi:peptide deformylase
MVKKIMRDPLFLAQKSVDATEDDKQVVTDLLDTLKANLDHCVGMAANMIGVKKNIIVVAAGPFQFAMINPVITGKSGAFQTEEGCLSLDGVRPCTRYKEIEVDYLDQKGVFKISKTSVLLCETLKVSKYTLYNYLEEARSSRGDKESEE